MRRWLLAGALISGTLGIACGTPTGNGNPSNGGLVVTGDVLSFDDSITTALGAHIVLPGDSIRAQILVTASQLLVATRDDVTWVGIRVSGPAPFIDSILIPPAYSKPPAAVEFVLVPPTGLHGLVTVSGFAHDADGNRDEDSLAGNPASLVTLLTPGNSQIGFGIAGGYAEDGPNGAQRFYWLPSSASLGVYEDNGRSTQVTLPAVGRDLDFTLGKDSLLITIPDSDEYGIVDLRVDSLHTDSLTLTLIRDTVSGAPGRPWLLRVSANDHAIVYRRDPVDTTIGSYVDWNVATGEQHLLSGPIVHGGMERTPDRSHIVVWQIAACCAGMGQVYDAATGTFSAPAPLGATDNSEVTFDGSSTRVLVGETLFRMPDLQPLATFHLPGQPSPTAVSTDGQVIYSVTAVGILRARVSDGNGYDVIDDGGPPSHVFATSDGTRLFMPYPSFVRYVPLPTLTPIASPPNRAIVSWRILGTQTITTLTGERVAR